MRNDSIGIFDSGVGGLNVLIQCQRLLPSERFIYIADKAHMPYGGKSMSEIKSAVIDVADMLFSMNCKALVVACNTATATAIDDIRRLYSTRIVVGLEPAVKPCFKELSPRGYGIALVTSATYRSEKFERLLVSCDGRVIPIACPLLAQHIENNTGNVSVLREHVYGLLKPYRDAESVVLGCSHYTYISGLVSEFYGGDVKIYDGAAGAAERLKFCLEQFGLETKNAARGGVKFFKTIQN